MKVTLGKEGLGKSHREPFPEYTDCHGCHRVAYIAFVAHEGLDGNPMWGTVKELLGPEERKQWLSGSSWPRGCVAVAVYLCPSCGTGAVRWNQEQ